MRIQYKRDNLRRSLPEGFIHPTQSKQYLKAAFASKIAFLGKPPYLGALCDFGWIKFEYFTGEAEPQKSQQKGIGVQIWHQVKRDKAPKTWWPLITILRRSSIALIDLEGIGEEYWRDWSEHTRRQRKKWYAQKTHYINEATKEEFLEAYQHCTLKPSLKSLFSHSLRRHVESYQENVHFLVVREKSTQTIIAGFMTVDDFETSQSFYPVAFILPVAKNTAASVGLVEYWLHSCQKKGLRYINLGIVWMPGDPLSWKGYSQFKALFHPQILLFQKPLVRFYWNR